MTAITAIQAAIAVPLIGSLFILLTGKSPNVREAVTLITALVLFAVVASITPEVLNGARPSVTFLEMLPGLALKLTVEPLGMLAATVASGFANAGQV